MAHELISVDNFRAELRTGHRPGAGIYRLAPADAISVDGAARKLRFCFSDGSVDRAGDTIDARGWKIDNYLRNPVVLWAHDSYGPPIGRASNVLIEDLRLMGDVEFAPPEIYEFADLIYRLVKARYLNAGSVGFLPIEYSWSNDDDREYGIDFEHQELLEYSICPVPANVNALAEARAKGIDTRPLVSWAEKVLDAGGKIVLPKAEIDHLRRLAQEPASRRRSGDAEWRCGAARDLSTDPSEDWDGGAAEASIFDWAGGDDFDSAKAKQGFLIFDAAAPKLRGSYKEPFAHVIGGQLKAVKGGIKAAASRLPQTDAPQAILDEARKVLDHYEEKFDMKTAPVRRDGMNGDDPSAGGFLATCGRTGEDECGMKSPEECAIHGPAMMEPKALLALVRREISAGLAASRREAPGTDDPPEHLRKAMEHVDAAGDALKALKAIDPQGDEDDGADDDARQECIRSMHAHVKAANDYIEAYRSANDDDDGDEAGNTEVDPEERAARIAALAR